VSAILRSAGGARACAPAVRHTDVDVAAVLGANAAALRAQPDAIGCVIVGGESASAFEAAAAQLDSVSGQRIAAEAVVQRHAAGDSPRMPAIGAQVRVLEGLEAHR
jgi:hypothetical protein